MPKNTFIFSIFGLILVLGIGIIIGIQVNTVNNRQSGATVDATVDAIAAQVVSTIQAQLSDSEAPVSNAVPTDVPATAIPPTRGDTSLSATDVLSASNVTTSADPARLLEIVEQNPFAIAVVGHNEYNGNQPALRAVPLRRADGRVAEPAPDSVISGVYPLSRLFYLYTTTEQFHTKPEVAAFIGCYLNRINEKVWDTGFFPVPQEIFDEALRTYNAAIASPSVEAPAVCSPNTLNGGSIDVTGSPTVAPITSAMATLFAAAGYTGDIRIESTSTADGFRQLCVDMQGDIVNADRPIRPEELASCLQNGQAPLAFAIGATAIHVVVNTENSSIISLDFDQLRALLFSAQLWSDVDPTWPNEPITRALPNQESGLFATIVDRVFGNERSAPSAPASLAQITSPTATPMPTDTPLPTATLQPTPVPETPVEAVAVAGQSIQPDQLSAARAALLSASNITMTTNPAILAAILRANPHAIGFMDNADFSNNGDQLRALPLIDGANFAADGQTIADSIVVVVGQSNEFVNQVSVAELIQLMTTATLWSNVNPAWPGEPIARAIPGSSSATLDLFARTILASADTAATDNGIDNSTNTVALAPQAEANRDPANTETATTPPPTAIQEPIATLEPTATVQPTATVAPTATPEPTPVGNVLTIGHVADRSECSNMTTILATIMQDNFDYQISVVEAESVDELFERLASAAPDAQNSIDLTTCYTDRDDREYLRQYGTALALLGRGYVEIDGGERKLYLLSHSSLIPLLSAEAPCTYQFLRSIRLDSIDGVTSDADGWIADNQDLITAWTTCLRAQ